MCDLPSADCISSSFFVRAECSFLARLVAFCVLERRDLYARNVAFPQEGGIAFLPHPVLRKEDGLGFAEDWEEKGNRAKESGWKMASEMVKAATSDKLKEMDWAKNIEICELVAQDPGYACHSLLP